MSNQLEIDEKTHKTIQELCALGDKFANSREFESAIAEYNKAWDLIPDPKNEWNAATWVLAAIADSAYLAGYKTSAREALEYAMTCPRAIGNPFLHMRYGQVLFDAGELDAAAEELMRAYMGAGKDIFSAEDSKYLVFLGSRAKL
ncbi:MULTISPECIES: hypothetical protein [unclassified Janthinobacterium]|uniref:hypothetical protein n=1 Tax=unclassified Janthinobacterium TaxID=2610881 RepID=UPI000874A726|nr:MULTISPECIES: hypothetical protein [unclassified Janthinobacterium]